MRIAVLGAAASALLGGTLAVTPLTSVSTPLPSAGTCSNGGAACGKVASVLMPETPTPSGPAAQAGAAPAAQERGGPAEVAPAANLMAPGVPSKPGLPGGPSAAR
jgi:hypothetical protein